MFYILKIYIKDATYYLDITEDKVPKNSEILFKTRNREDIRAIAEQIHRNSINDPNRIHNYQKEPRKERGIHSKETREKISE